MLNHISGTLLSLTEDKLIIDLHGLGISVLVSRKVRENLLDQENKKVFLFTRLIIRENEVSIFGFFTEHERLIFDHLIEIQGVGPRSALTFFLFSADERSGVG